MKVWSEVCSTCELGAAHARGERPKRWPDGTLVVNVDIVPVSAILRSKPIRRREKIDLEFDLELA